MRTTGWVVGALAVASLAAPAESLDWFGRDRHYRIDAGHIAYDRGFRDGAKHGSKDGRKGVNFNFQHDRHYRNADYGYRSSYGPRFLYQRAYREGYRDGYTQGYESRLGYYDRGRYGPYGRDGYGPYGRRGGYRYPDDDDRDDYYRDRDYRDDDRVIYERPPRY
jgi:hypothetical protein